MDWQHSVKQRYTKEGWDAFHQAHEAFKNRLELFCAERGISIIDDNPEGEDWMILLKDGTELYVERRSYETGSAQTDFWIEYSPKRGGIVAEFFNAHGRPAKYEVVVPNDQITAVFDKWQ